MPTLTVGPNSSFPSIADAMLAANPNDTILLQDGYSGETAEVTHNGMIISGDSTSKGIILRLGTGVTAVTLEGTAPIDVRDNADGNDIVGNGGDNEITVKGGADAVNGGLGVDRLVVDYRLAGAVTGDSTSNFTEAGGGGRTVTITAGTIENFTVLTGAGSDTLTVGNGKNIVDAGKGANTITAGNGVNRINGGGDADTITAGDGGNSINAGSGANVVTTGAGNDRIRGNTGADTVVAGGGDDGIRVRGGADSVDGGAGDDRLVVDYSGFTTDVIGGVTGGNLASGYTGHFADQIASTVDFVAIEYFRVETGDGDDNIRTGNGSDVLIGNAGNDTLRGRGGNDSLDGGVGDDWLDGGAGRDMLIGGAGDDTFAFARVGDTVVGSMRDRILDFASGDRIDLTGMEAETGTAFNFIQMAAFSNTAGEVRQFSSGGDTFVEGDVDGNGSRDYQIRLTGSHTLTDASFIF